MSRSIVRFDPFSGLAALQRDLLDDGFFGSLRGASLPTDALMALARTPMFQDRVDAGRRLGRQLIMMGVPALVVFGLPRGGVPVAAAVSDALGAPLDAIVVRKLGLPSHPEVAIGAIGEDQVRIVNTELVRRLGVTPAELDAVEQRERVVVERRATTLHGDRPPRDVTGQAVLIVDDGIATGATASAACLVARKRGAAEVIVAAPVGGRDAVNRVDGADKVICLEQPAGFQAVGQFYRNFDQITDSDVVRLLTARSNRRLKIH